VLEFSGTLTNTTSTNQYLNADNFNLAGFDPSAIDGNPFFANAPLFPGPDGATGDIGLFDIASPNPFAPGNHGGVFQILGGVNGDAQDIIGSVDFTVAVQQTSAVPEPAFRPDSPAPPKESRSFGRRYVLFRFGCCVHFVSPDRAAVVTIDQSRWEKRQGNSSCEWPYARLERRQIRACQVPFL